MPDRLNPLIIAAIQERRVLSLVYKGRPVDVEPYTYGHMLSGRDFIYGWQRSGTFSNWRFFWLHLSRDIRLSDVVFEAPRADYSTSGLGHISEIYAQLEGAPAPWLTVPDQNRATRLTPAQPFSKMPRAWGGPVAGLRPAALIFESDASSQEALALVLINSGYDVTLAASAEEAHRLMRERSFDRIYSSGEPRVQEQDPSPQVASSGPRVEDQGDGTARVRLDQVLPWSSAVELLDVLATTTLDDDAQKEIGLLS